MRNVKNEYLFTNQNTKEILQNFRKLNHYDIVKNFEYYCIYKLFYLIKIIVYKIHT